MDKFSPLIEYVNRHVRLTEQEEDYFRSLLRYARVKKRQFLAQPGHVSTYQSFVLKGCLRAFHLDEKGMDHTVRFAIEDWWIADFESFINQVPATLFVEAMEDSELIQIDYRSVQLLFEQMPKFERFSRIITQRSYLASQNRIISDISSTAEARYLAFLNHYPDIAMRVPQYTLASYLGMTTEFLSKIRKRLAKA